MRRVVAVALLAAAGWLAVGSPVAAEEMAAKVDVLFEEWNKPDTPGCALGVLRDGELIYAQGYGLASLEHGVPISSATVFRTGSVGKQFTALAVLLAEAAGELSLDDDIREYLPELAEHDPPITIAHLVHHTSGLRDYLDLMYLAGFREEAHYDNRQVMEVLARQSDLNFEPGSDYLYSNTGYFLLSQIIERATGKTLREWSEEVMFAPLGMSSTHFHDDPWMVVPKRAYGYSRREEGGFQVNMTTLEMVGDGGVFTTIDDLVAWERNFIEPRVGGPEVLEKRTTPGRLTDGTPQVYAAGLTVGAHRGLPVVQHGGAFVGFRAATVRFPEERFAVYCLCNVGEASPMSLALEVVDLYLADRLGPKSKPAPEPIAGDTVAHLVGTYADPASAELLEITLEEGELRASFGGDPWVVSKAPEDAPRYLLHREAQSLGLSIESSESQRVRLTVSREGRRPVVYERVERVTPSAGELSEYVGRYRSAELDATWQVVQQEDGQLVVRLPPRDDEAREPLYEDVFSWDWGHAIFVRDASGRIDRLLLGTYRARRIEMPRERDS